MDHGSAIKAFGATAFISTVPNLILVLVPVEALLRKPKSGGINNGNVMLAFAAGGILGDVFIHSLPHLLEKHEHGHGHHEHMHEHGHHEHEHEHGHHEHDHDHHHALYVGLLVLIGYVIFYVAERVANLRMSGRAHAHDHAEPRGVHDDKVQTTKRPSRSRSSSSKKAPANNDGIWLALTQKMVPSGWLNLLADSMHNFTDGVALGASFASVSGNSRSHFHLVKMISILFHEVPHELGDFTILVNAGLSKWQAIQAQFVTAIAAFFGTAVGYVFSSSNETAKVVLESTTSGGFIYIATGIVASIAVSSTEGSKQSQSASYTQIVLEVCCFALGVGIMVLVALME